MVAFEGGKPGNFPVTGFDLPTHWFAETHPCQGSVQSPSLLESSSQHFDITAKINEYLPRLTCRSYQLALSIHETFLSQPTVSARFFKAMSNSLGSHPLPTGESGERREQGVRQSPDRKRIFGIFWHHRTLLIKRKKINVTFRTM